MFFFVLSLLLLSGVLIMIGYLLSKVYFYCFGGIFIVVDFFGKYELSLGFVKFQHIDVCFILLNKDAISFFSLISRTAIDS